MWINPNKTKLIVKTIWEIFSNEFSSGDVLFNLANTQNPIDPIIVIGKYGSGFGGDIFPSIVQ